jgi:Translocon-associated protein beta (TRAPB)
MFRKTWSRVNAGAAASADVVVEPRRSGELLVNPASLTYKDGNERRTTRLASEERIVVEDATEYRRRTATHGSAWLAFAACTTAAIALPYLKYSSAISVVSAAQKRA